MSTPSAIAFPGDVVSLMPPMEAIPREYDHGLNWANRLFVSLFYEGGSAAHLIAKPGIDRLQALRHIRVIMGSFQPKHEHKEAACAYLFASWFEAPTPTEAP